jgi:hypothetical protein
MESIMGWWTSVVDGAKALRNGVGSYASWAWDSVSLTGAATEILTYTSNTVFQILEQGLALRTAIPTLINNLAARKIVKDMAYVAVVDVLPLLALNAANNKIQDSCRAGHQNDTPWYTAYSLFLSGLTLVNYTVKAYTWRQSAQSFTRIIVLDSLGPPAFNSNKTTTPPSLCNDLECTTKRKMKGWGREPLILLGNDVLTKVISYIPYVGPPTSEVLSVFFMGRYITRLVTPERCERHKQMMQESVLAFGLTYTASTMLMNYYTGATGDLPLSITYRTMRHLLLLLHINVAAHMKIPLMPKNAPVYRDPLNVYERGTRFIADVIFEGLKVRVPIDFKMEDGAKPIIPLSQALKLGTMVLRSDLPTLDSAKPGFAQRVAKKTFNTLSPWVLPPMYRSGNAFINDKIISRHWEAIRGGAISFVEIINSIGRTNSVKSALVKTAVWVPGTTEKALKYKWGIPKVVTRIGLKLSRKEDFWDFAAALKGWFERHNIQFDVQLVDHSQIPLLGEKRIEPPPINVDKTPITSADKLVTIRTPRSSDAMIKPDQLVSTRTTVPHTAAASPHSLFTTRRRGGQGARIAAPEADQSLSSALQQ